MTRPIVFLWATLVALMIFLFPACTPSVDDTAPEGDADADADADTDTDTDFVGSVYAMAGEPVEFALDDNPSGCPVGPDCLFNEVTAGEHKVSFDLENYLFALPQYETITIASPGEQVDVDFTNRFEAGKWGAEFPATCVETDEDDGDGETEHEVVVFQEDGFVKFGMSRADGCQIGSPMTGLVFDDYGDDGYTCSGYGTGTNAGDKLVVDYSPPGYDPLRIHCVF